MGSALFLKSFTYFVITIITCGVIQVTYCRMVRNTRSEHSYRYDDFFREMRIDGKLSEIQNGNHTTTICYLVKFSTFILLDKIVL